MLTLLLLSAFTPLRDAGLVALVNQVVLFQGTSEDSTVAFLLARDGSTCGESNLKHVVRLSEVFDCVVLRFEQRRPGKKNIGGIVGQKRPGKEKNCGIVPHAG